MDKRRAERRGRKSKKVEDLSVSDGKQVVGGGTSTTTSQPVKYLQYDLKQVYVSNVSWSPS